MSKKAGPLVPDASVVINLLAMEPCTKIIEALGAPFLVPGHVAREVRRDPRGGSGQERVAALVKSGHLLLREVPDELAEEFIELTGAPSPDDLGDGESATIVLASAARGRLALDDGRARRIATQRHSDLTQYCTLELIELSVSLGALSGAEGAAAVHDAVRFARMAIPKDMRHVAERLAKTGASRLRG